MYMDIFHINIYVYKYLYTFIYVYIRLYVFVHEIRLPGNLHRHISHYTKK